MMKATATPRKRIRNSSSTPPSCLFGSSFSRNQQQQARQEKSSRPLPNLYALYQDMSLVVPQLVKNKISLLPQACAQRSEAPNKIVSQRVPSSHPPMCSLTLLFPQHW